MFCTQCGQQNPDEAQFCSKCGATLENRGGGAASASPGKKASGGFPVWLIVLLVLMVCGVPVLGILAAIALPAYQDYTVKAKMSQVHAVGMKAQVFVSRFIAEKNKLPATLEETGFTTDSPPQLLSSASIDGESGVISLAIGFPPHRGKILKYVPVSADGRNISSWKCGSDEIPGRYLPAACR